MTRGIRGASLTGALTIAGMIGALAGCGSSTQTADLAGNVTIGGKPIPDDAEAVITFAPVDQTAGKPVIAPITDGSYEVSGVPTGKVRVVFEITRPVGPKKVSERTGLEYQEEENLVPPGAGGDGPLTIDGNNPNLNFDL